MGYDVRVDVDLLLELAQRLDEIGEDLARVAQGAASAWRLAAGAAGSGDLRAVADDSARRWGAGLDWTGHLAAELSHATRESAQAYRDVEATLARVWTTRTGLTGRHARWQP
ncbi:MAG: hypothetical protein Q4P07_04145 [Ornithinimicrobium sp.]|uniref:hypothetical protein n=1 Tax=Ornithinimicrobium sp. TaxID=1977084 RepID=UPI0026DECEAD|nr:hypothetical protein [Ornithinimicrobium sp.]MDO5739321.1 hypothetical protein [Ornithinimicrobium sp.]